MSLKEKLRTYSVSTPPIVIGDSYTYRLIKNGDIEPEWWSFGKRYFTKFGFERGIKKVDPSGFEIQQMHPCSRPAPVFASALVDDKTFLYIPEFNNDPEDTEGLLFIHPDYKEFFPKLDSAYFDLK